MVSLLHARNGFIHGFDDPAVGVAQYSRVLDRAVTVAGDFPVDGVESDDRVAQDHSPIWKCGINYWADSNGPFGDGQDGREVVWRHYSVVDLRP